MVASRGERTISFCRLRCWNDNVDSSHRRYLQVIDVLLGVQVDATGSLLDGHDREADVDAAVKFAFLDLRVPVMGEEPAPRETHSV
ncbi:hypothetical protein EYF80_053781 [Liparis tanakae]|uniref:Uncharacterized protein n=1 Tax=Liparis tanakae TaxID=230148 RepID=A0A4Z2F576_9TELE|nr:hypothetical protein EYF80_053781 [Liparis tanakae]